MNEIDRSTSPQVLTYSYLLIGQSMMESSPVTMASASPVVCQASPWGPLRNPSLCPMPVVSVTWFLRDRGEGRHAVCAAYDLYGRCFSTTYHTLPQRHTDSSSCLGVGKNIEFLIRSICGHALTCESTLQKTCHTPLHNSPLSVVFTKRNELCKHNKFQASCV